MNLFYAIMIPFLGTTLGSACVYLLKKELNQNIQKFLLGFASGVMVAASVWSLIIPAIEDCENLGRLAFLPATIGIALGFAFLFLLDIITPHLHVTSNIVEGPHAKLKQSTKMFLAVTLHNIPEGMAVGVVFAAFITQNAGFAAAATLALGIAIQNFPEGAIISMSLAKNGENKHKSFLFGTISGIVEPIATMVTILLKDLIVPVLPYLLSFAAGAMLYVVVEELIPEASEEPHSNNGTIGFSIGFILMMCLDVALG